MSVFRSDIERRAWGIVQDLPEFHWTDLQSKGIPQNTAETVIQNWAKAGRIRQVRKDGHRKIWVNAAFVPNPDPQAVSAKSPEDAMWICIRRIGIFTPSEIGAHANAAGHEITIQSVQAYCRKLVAAGYLRVRQTAIPGQREPAYQLVNDTGPKAPISKRVTGIFDPNTETFTPADGVTS